jgi:RNA polymerase sigma-70 factor (ECF subfamily)
MGPMTVVSERASTEEVEFFGTETWVRGPCLGGKSAMNDEDLARLFERAEAGDAEAIRILRQFEQDIRLMVRVRLPRALRPQFDSMDFVQDIWQSFFKIFHEDPGRFSDSQFLRKFLAGMARNKVFEEHRRRTHAQKYDLSREEPLYIRRGDRDVPRDVVSPAPSPVENAQAREWLAQLLAGRSAEETEVIKLRLSGLTFEEIAEQTGCHERTIRRLFESIRDRLRARQEPS